MAETLWDAITRRATDFIEGGQERRQWLDDLGRRAEYYVPPELRNILGFAAEMTPTAAIDRAAQAGGEMLAPGRTPMQRLGSAGQMLSETASVVAPAMVANRAAMPAAQAIQESLLGASMAADDVGRRFVERMNQPGPVPTMYSNPIPGGDGGGLLGRGDVRSYSAALRSAENLKQNKGSYEQLKAMMMKDGAKADEFAWTGADAQFAGKKVTKEELADYFRNATETLGEEVRVGGKSGISRVDMSPEEMARQYAEANLDDEAQFYLNEYLPEMAEQDTLRVRDLNENDLAELADALDVDPDDIDLDAFVDDDLTRLIPEDELLDYRFGDPEEYARQLAEESMYENALYEARQDPVDFAETRLGLTEDDLYSNVEYGEYFPEGGTQYRERLYTYEDPRGEIEPDSLAAQGHYAEDPENPMFAWSRTAEFPAYGQGAVRNVETGDIFPHNPNSAWERNLLESNPGKYEIISPGGPAGRAHYVGEIQSDAAQRLKKRADQTGMVPRGYQETLAAQEYTSALKPYNLAATDAYYKFADVFNAMPRDDRAAMASRVAWQNFRREFPDMPLTAGEMTEAQADQFLNWAPGDLGVEAQTFSQAARWANALENASTGNNYLDAMAANFRAAEAAKNQARQEMAGLLSAGADPDKFLPGGPLLDKTGKWTEFALRRNLEDAIRGGADYLVVPDDMGAMGRVGGGSRPTEGTEQYYRNIVQPALKNLARKYDKKANLFDVMLGEGNNKFPGKGIQLTPEFIDAVARKGIPIWMLAGAVPSYGLLSQQEQEVQ